MYKVPVSSSSGLVNVIEVDLGCTDSSADNYNPDANIDDGTRQYFDVQILMLKILMKVQIQTMEVVLIHLFTSQIYLKKQARASKQFKM